MKNRNLVGLCLVASSIFSYSGISLAADNGKGAEGVVIHTGEVGPVDHTPFKSEKTKEQIRKELNEAHKNGSHQMGGESPASTNNQPSTGKTRDEVKKELVEAHKNGTHNMGGESDRTR
jgi:hypothetical protein